MQGVLTAEPFRREHLGAALALSAGEGWPHRAADWDLVLSLSEGVALTAAGELAGCGLLTRFGSMGRLSMILVAPQMRGRGLGTRILAELLGLAGDLPLSLCATRAGAPLYARFGFRVEARVGQWQGIARPAGNGGAVAEGDPAAAAVLDLAATGADRRALIGAFAGNGALLSVPGGYAVLRPFGKGHVLGPAIAPDLASARLLVQAAARRRAGGFLRIDVPEESGLEPDLAAIGLRCADAGTVMARGDVPPAKGLWALASQGFG